jgi:hypothetical protein
MTGKKIKAVRRGTEIVAECMYGGICVSKIDGSNELLICGNYDGLIENKHGKKVICMAGSERRPHAD